MSPCTSKLDEEKPIDADVSQENGFSFASLISLPRLIESAALKLCTC
jgi:hypothetical protein